MKAGRRQERHYPRAGIVGGCDTAPRTKLTQVGAIVIAVATRGPSLIGARRGEAD